MHIGRNADVITLMDSTSQPRDEFINISEFLARTDQRIWRIRSPIIDREFIERQNAMSINAMSIFDELLGCGFYRYSFANRCNRRETA